MKKYFAIFILIIFSSSMLKAQVKSDSLQNKKNKWSIYFMGGGVILTKANFDYSSGYVSDNKSVKATYNFEMGGVSQINKVIGLTAGINYVVLGYSMERDERPWGYPFYRKDTYSFSFINFPMAMTVGLGRRKLKANFEFGPEISVMAKNNISTYTWQIRQSNVEEGTSSTSAFNNGAASLSFRIGLGFGYVLNNHFNIFFNAMDGFFYRKLVDKDLNRYPLPDSNPIYTVHFLYFKVNCGIKYFF